ncbi:MAG: hypothetical protein WBZ28_03200 [Pseudolabrys sp.]
MAFLQQMLLMLGIPVEQKSADLAPKQCRVCENINGMILFGVSTAYIFAVMQMYWSVLTARATPSNG